MSFDLVCVLLSIVLYVCLSVILREIVGPFHSVFVSLSVLAFLQLLHLMLLITALTVQLSSLSYLYFGDRFMSSASFDFKRIYRIGVLILSLSGTILFCKIGAGFCNSTPFFFYFLDNTGMKTDAIRDMVYVPFLATFFILVTAIQVFIERRKRKLTIADKLSKTVASSAVNRLKFAFMALHLKTPIEEKDKNFEIYKSSPCVCYEEEKMKQKENDKRIGQKSFDSFTHKIFSRKFVGERQNKTKKNPKSQTVYSIQIEVNPSTTFIKFDELPNFTQVRCKSLKKSNSCPEFKSLPDLSRNSRKLNLKKLLKQTRALSIFLMIPTMMLFLHNALGGIDIAKPHSNVIFNLATYGILTPLVFIVGKTNVRKFAINFLKKKLFWLRESFNSN